MSELERLALAELALLYPRQATIGSITKRLGGWPKIDGREVRVSLDVLVDAGKAVYLEGKGNNRSYRFVEHAPC